MTEQKRVSVPMPHPYLTPDQIPYHCWCGYRATLDKQAEHRASHKGDHKIATEKKEEAR